MDWEDDNNEERDELDDEMYSSYPIKEHPLDGMPESVKAFQDADPGVIKEVLEWYKYNEGTCDACAIALGNRRINSISPAVSHLKYDGKIIDTGDRAYTSGGCRAAIMRISRPDEEVLLRRHYSIVHEIRSTARTAIRRQMYFLALDLSTLPGGQPRKRMRIANGNMWDTDADIYIVTGNATIKKDGSLVMGRGAALDLKNKVPNIDKMFGALIQKRATRVDTNKYKYGVLFAKYQDGKYYGIFQVKWNFREQADLELIKYSIEKLDSVIRTHFIDGRVSMNFPAIGNGGLSRKVVEPLLSNLPSNLTVWIRAKNTEDLPEDVDI